jgi:hypothetical protein
VIISHGQLGHPGTAHPRLLTTEHVAAVASAGGLIGAWPCGITSRSLADFAAETLRLTEVAGPGHVAIGTDLDGNYRPVLTRYHQLADLAGLLRDRALRRPHPAGPRRQRHGPAEPHPALNASHALEPPLAPAGMTCATRPGGKPRRPTDPTPRLGERAEHH